VFGERDPTHKPPPGLSALVRLLRSDGGRPCGPEDLGLGFYTLQGWLKGVNSERLQPSNDIGHDGDLADGSMDNDLIGRDAFGFALGYYGDNDFAAIANAWTSTPGERAFTPIGVDVPANTLATNHAPLYNGNIAHTVYTLQPFGAGWDIGNTEGQVLAQVYTYDQLNRLKKARGVAGLTNTNTWIGVTDGATNRYRSQYEYDANGNIISANRYDNDGNHYDQFAYKYQKRDGRTMRNRLYELYDDADAADNYVNEIGGAEDINYNQTITNPLDPAYFDEEDPALNGLHNYHYDALGNLIHDEREQIQAIEWTVAGKVKSVSRTTGSIRKPLSFAYGASGQRILKTVSDPDLDVTGSREHYIRDAQGNIMATYRYTNPGSASLHLNDRPLYGSARLGTLGEEMELHSLLNWDPADPVLVDQVDLNYELTDHLGNVCAVVTGRLLDGAGGGTLKQAELVSAQGYEPFGSLLPGRNYSASSYRFGFQGQEKDNELFGAEGTALSFEYRVHDARLGRFLSIDPLAFSFPWNSPYAFSENRVLDMVELEGLEAAPTEDKAQSLPEPGETRPDGQGGVYSGLGDEHFGGSQKGSDYRPEGWYDDFSPTPAAPSASTPDASNGLPSPSSSFKVEPAHGFQQTPPTGKQYFAGDRITDKGLFYGLGYVAKDLNTAIEIPSIPIAGLAQNLTNVVNSRSQYGRLSSTTIVRTNFGFNINLNTKPLLKALSVAKKFGIAGAVLGGASSIAKFRTGEIGGPRLAADLIMGGVGLLPGAGWVVSGSYSLIMNRYDNYLKEGCIICW